MRRNTLPMPIVPLPVFEADADPHHRSAMSDEEIYARREAPKTIVIRFGHLKHVAEYPYDGTAKPGCGSKLVARTHRGTEVVEMLTTTCANSGCGKSVSRREMLDYIDNSGGKDYPFHTKGRILRVASIDDLNQQSSLEGTRREAVKFAKALVADLKLPMKIVEAEPIIGGECLTFYYMSEQRIDFRDLVQRLASRFSTRIEMRQVGARDEARIVADYERCGQHCCCKNFLKVRKPVSMRQAKVQKATLDPWKISGRCGRLMCCLRYEDQTYKELKANLPHRNTRVGTAEGPGVVIDTKILVQLVLVRLEHDMREVAVPVEELMHPDKCPRPKTPAEMEAERAAESGGDAMRRDRERERSRDRTRGERGGMRDRDQRRDKPAVPPSAPAPGRPASKSDLPLPMPGAADDPLRGMSEEHAADRAGDEPRKKKRRRRRKRRGGGGDVSGAPRAPAQSGDLGNAPDMRTPSDADRHRQQDAFRNMAQNAGDGNDDDVHADNGDDGAEGAGPVGNPPDDSGGGQAQPEGQRRRRRRRRRRGGRRRDGGGGRGDAGGGPPQG